MRKLSILLLLLSFALPAVAIAQAPAPAAKVVVQKSKTKKTAALKTAATTLTVALNWVASVVPAGGQPVTSYNIYRSTSSGTEVLLASNGSPTPSYTDGAVSIGTTYFYQTTAVNQCGSPLAACQSGKSNEVSILVVAPATPAPNPPTGLTVTQP